MNKVKSLMDVTREMSERYLKPSTPMSLQSILRIKDAVGEDNLVALVQQDSKNESIDESGPAGWLTRQHLVSVLKSHGWQHSHSGPGYNSEPTHSFKHPSHQNHVITLHGEDPGPPGGPQRETKKWGFSHVHGTSSTNERLVGEGSAKKLGAHLSQFHLQK